MLFIRFNLSQSFTTPGLQAILILLITVLILCPCHLVLIFWSAAIFAVVLTDDPVFGVAAILLCMVFIRGQIYAQLKNNQKEKTKKKIIN